MKALAMERITFVMRVKDGKQDEYIRRHHEVWPEVLTDLRRAGVHKLSMFLRGVELFVYMEVEDYVEAVRILNNSPHSIRWEQHMAPIMESVDGNDYDPANPYPEPLPEIFFWQESDVHRELQHLRQQASSETSPSMPHYQPLRKTLFRP